MSVTTMYSVTMFILINIGVFFALTPKHEGDLIGLVYSLGATFMLMLAAGFGYIIYAIEKKS